MLLIHLLSTFLAVLRAFRLPSTGAALAPVGAPGAVGASSRPAIHHAPSYHVDLVARFRARIAW